MDIDWDKVKNDIATFGVEIYPLEECTIKGCLGSGSTMEVFEGQCNINTVTRNVAFKRHMKFKNPKLKQKDVDVILQDFKHDITLMRSPKYPKNVVRIYGVTFEERKPVLIVEAGNKTLDKYLLDKAESGIPATWCEKIKLCKDISRSVRCLHDAGVTHGNIKGENVLVFIESTGIITAKLSSFGHSSTMNPSNGNTSGNKTFMTPETRAVEELRKPAQDIFNFGLVIYQIANDGKTSYEDLERILKVDSTSRHNEVLLANLRPDTPEVFRVVIASTTKYMPTERASLDFVEKIIYDYQNVSFSQVNAANTPLPYLALDTESPQLIISALEIISHFMSDSKQFYLDKSKNNLKTTELNEVKRSYEEAKNILESFIIHNRVLDVNKLLISPSLKQSIFHEYQQLAEVGDVFAQFMSGVCWINGFGTEKDNLKAVEYFAKAAEFGNGHALDVLGFCYNVGIGITKDILKAIKLYAMAAEAGNIKAQCNLGSCYEEGDGVTVDYVKAVEWYTKAAEANFPPAQNYLGICYEKGLGVTKDLTKAFELFTKAAVAGDPEAQCNLGLCYEYGKSVTEDSTKAAEWYKKAAEAGNARAQNNLGYFYEKGIEVPKDCLKAFQWYNKGAEGGDYWAQNALGYCYQFGIGVPKNELKAIEWYTKSAEANNVSGQENLAFCYEKGIGINRDYNRAIELYTNASKAGSETAELNIGRLRRK